MAYLSLQVGIISSVILYVIAHAESIDRSPGRQTPDGLLDICHRLGGKSLYVALLDGVVGGRGIIRTVGIGNLRVADDNHLITDFLSSR